MTFNKSNMILPQSIALLITEMMPTMFKTKVNLQGAAKWFYPHVFLQEYKGVEGGASSIIGLEGGLHRV